VKQESAGKRIQNLAARNAMNTNGILGQLRLARRAAAWKAGFQVQASKKCRDIWQSDLQ
jgi:hypothetical protein